MPVHGWAKSALVAFIIITFAVHLEAKKNKIIHIVIITQLMQVICAHKDGDQFPVVNEIDLQKHF